MGIETARRIFGKVMDELNLGLGEVAGLKSEKGSGGETPQPSLRGVGSERGGFDPEVVKLKMRKDMER